MADKKKTLYERLGGHDAIAAVANDLLPRLQSDPQLGRFWAHRGEDQVKREKQLLIDFLCASTGGRRHRRDPQITSSGGANPAIGIGKEKNQCGVIGRTQHDGRGFGPPAPIQHSFLRNDHSNIEHQVADAGLTECNFEARG